MGKNSFLKSSVNPIGFSFQGTVDADKVWAQVTSRRYTPSRGKGWRSPIFPFSPAEFVENEFFFGARFLLLKYQVNIVPAVQSWTKVVFDQLVAMKEAETGKLLGAAEKRELKEKALDDTLAKFPRKPVLMDVLVDLENRIILAAGASAKEIGYMLPELQDTLGVQTTPLSNWNIEKKPDVVMLRNLSCKSRILENGRRPIWEPILSEFLTWLFYTYMHRQDSPIEVLLPLLVEDSSNRYAYSGGNTDPAALPELFTGLLYGKTITSCRVDLVGKETGVCAKFGLDLEPKSLKIYEPVPDDNVYAWLCMVMDKFLLARRKIQLFWTKFLEIRKTEESWSRECRAIKVFWRKILQDLKDEADEA